MPVAVNAQAGTSFLAGKTVVSVSASRIYSQALLSDGTVAAWGYNLYGQLGDNSTTNRLVPVAVNAEPGISALAGKTVIAIAPSIALCSDGAIAAWGGNSRTNRRVPVAVNAEAGISALTGKSVVAVAQGRALCSDGTVIAWNGTDPTTGLLLPSAVNVDEWISVLAGRYVSGMMIGSLGSTIVIYAAPQPEIQVEVMNPNITALIDRVSTVDFGLAVAEGRTFRVRNGGGLPLMSLSASLTGADSASFTLVSRPPAVIAGSGTSIFEVVFTGTSPGVKSATLVISSNDSDEATFSISLAGFRPATWTANFATATDIIQSALFIDLSGVAVDLALNFAPALGTNLTIIKNTGQRAINGRFSNLANGATVILTYNGGSYRFVVWYYGGEGKNDLVLLWPHTGLAAWGENNDGQLGDKTTTDRSVPVGVEQNGILKGKTVVQVAHGGDHSLALCSDGTVAAWGRNTEGQLGDNSTANRSVPVAVKASAGLSALAGKTVVAVAAGKSHSLAFCSDGTMAAWGYNDKGQLGDNTTTNRQVPVAVNMAAGTSALAGKTVVAVAAGKSHSLALCSDGTVTAWGYNDRAQLGNYNLTQSLVPVAVNMQNYRSALSGKSVSAIAAGGDHCLALCSDGTLVGWGWDEYRQVGSYYDSNISQYLPTEVNVMFGESALAGKTVVAITAGAYHSLALCSDGTLVSWGNGSYGQLGNNSTTNRSVPVAVNVTAGTSTLAGKTVVAISAGHTHNLALCSDGTTAAWGWNGNGQLGDNSTTQRLVPVAVKVAAGTSVVAGLPVNGLSVGSCSYHSLATFGQVPESLIAVTTNGTDVTMASTVEFGDAEVLSAQVLRSFTISNLGNSPLNITGTPLVSISGSDAAAFSITREPFNAVDAYSSMGFAITFDPSIPGPHTATVTIQSDARNHPSFSFIIRGFGVLSKRRTQTITFSPPSVLYFVQDPVKLSAFASSGLPVTLSIVNSGETTWATIVDNVLMGGYGSMTVQAVQAGDGVYAPAPTVRRTIWVGAYPRVLTLFNLTQTYSGTPREISTTSGASVVTIEYKIGTAFGSTAPTNVGTYAVRATDSKGTKTGTLVIAKAPLFVTPDDKNKFVGQDNPPLTLKYSGWVSGDTASLVTTAPVLKTTATKTSIGGVYPITASGGALLANYAYIYQQGSLVVDSFAANYEALLTDSSDELVGKLAITVVAANTSFTGKLYCIDEKAVLSLNGPLLSNPATESATGNATVSSSGIPYVVSITTRIDGSLTTTVTRAGNAYASLSTGRRLLTLAAGKTVTYSGAHTAALEPALPAGNHVPKGTGWATATISTTGMMTLTGKLGDGTTFTTSLAPDNAADPVYRLFVQPYKTGTATRLQSHFGGAFTLLPHPSLVLAGRRYVEAAAMTWVKTNLAADATYPAGFGPVSSVMMLDPWLPPAAAKGSTPASTLATRLGLTNSSFQVLHSDTGSALNGNLPTRVGLGATNLVSVTTPSANTTKWKTTLVPTTGLFSGSFELADTLPKPRAVTFSGVLRQPATAPDTLIGDGHYLLPPLTSTEKATTGEVMFLRP
jgi:alpha-tubulin suppressor-like RCC1 family protein